MERGRAWRRKQYWKRRNAWLKRMEAEDVEFSPHGVPPEYENGEDPQYVNRIAAGKRAASPAWCSCIGCGTVRNTNNKGFFPRREQITHQELRSEDDFLSQLDDLWCKVWGVRKLPWS